MTSESMHLWESISKKTSKPLADDQEKDYPGRSLPRNRPGGELYETRREAKYGETYYDIEIDGEVRRFYTIGTVANIFGRMPGTIRSWETKGILPKPRFRTPPPPGGGLGQKPIGRRLYTQEQVDYLILLCERYNMRSLKQADWQGFTEAMRDYPTT